MTLSDADAERLAALVDELTGRSGHPLPDEGREDAIIAEMKRLSPDPRIMDHIFWPHGVPHPPGAPDLTTNEIIERVRRYRPVIPPQR